MNYREVLLSILKLEEMKNWTNVSVSGGIDRFIENNKEKLFVINNSSSFKKLLGSSYTEMNKSQRKKWVKLLNDFLISKNVIVDSKSFKDEEQYSNYERNIQLLSGSLSNLPTVGKSLLGKLEKLGLNCIEDLVYLSPNYYRDFSLITKIRDISSDNIHTVVANVWETRVLRRGKSFRKDTEAIIGDETGNCKAVWYGQPFVAKNLKTKSQFVFSGQVKSYKGINVLQSPEYEVVFDSKELIHTGRLVPVYPLTKGLSGKNIRKLTKFVLDNYLQCIPEVVPLVIRKQQNLLDLNLAIMKLHYPSTMKDAEIARRTLVFTELLLLQLGLLLKKPKKNQNIKTPMLVFDEAFYSYIVNLFPFELTEDQSKVIKEILNDMNQKSIPMNRLLQGEVGSGKTVVAFTAMLICVKNGFQSVLMAPTEILAEQHFNTLDELLRNFGTVKTELNIIKLENNDKFPDGITIGLLTGGMSQKEKQIMRNKISMGDIDIVVGTQSLIQEDTLIPKLGLAVIDEQHRFGVLQRASLREKSLDLLPHILTMSATPIPRSLALTFYGELDISTIRQLPKGRQKIATKLIPLSDIHRAYKFLRKQIELGRQAFVVCPLISESESLQIKSAEEEFERLTKLIFPELKIGLLHGKMKTKEKDEIMQEFKNNRINILVSTPVIEVGIDIPNASVILIETAERFGLSQLHQLRGRVGRGEHKSYCVLVAETSAEFAEERLKAMEKSYDGFELAEVDLKLRGPGDYLGTRQSGLPDFRIANLNDTNIISSARNEAQKILNNDPLLYKNNKLRLETERFLNRFDIELPEKS